MDAITTLHTRVSQGVLSAPAPADKVLENIKKAALRAADHGMLRPWRFLVIAGEGLTRFGELLVRATEADGGPLTDREKEKIAARPRRAPMIIAVISSPRENPKIPAVEQLLSAAAAAQNMLNAAFAQGVGAMWRTGGFAYHPEVMRELGLTEGETIVGFLYLGTMKTAPPSPPELNPEEYFNDWV